jgi:Alw26I/Eco31I/Esp3I family type II restriction m6 adenine DNA methyltransferase
VILSDPFSQDEFTEFITGFLPDFELDIRKVEAGSSGFSEVLRLGESVSLLTSVLIVRSKKNINSRISLTNNSFKILKNYQIYRALIVYVNEDETIWRLSLLTAIPAFDSSGKVIMSYSNPRRHSYVLGSDVGIATARKYLSNMGKIIDFEDLQFRFSIEVVNKDFYKEIASHFYQLVGIHDVEGKQTIKPQLKIPEKNMKVIYLHNYAVRLLGRVIFIWFLRNKISNGGAPLMPLGVLGEDNAKVSDLLHSKMEPIFFEILNKPINSRDSRFRNTTYDMIPYLNGGLFHASEGEGGDYYDTKLFSSNVEIPDKWFVNLFSTLNTYNFTIDENLENDIDLSIDPEMLGRVFENLLAEINPETGQVARKSTGSFYTPRIIVNFMVEESLTKYLISNTKVTSDLIRRIIATTDHSDEELLLSNSDRTQIIEAVSKIRFLDPACGSGAFPISVLQRILWVVSRVDPKGEEFIDSQDFEGTENWLTESRLDYLRKRKIIRDNLFGIDIQSVAVEIAKLRCFLTLIVDQEIEDGAVNRGVIPLPNLDFKFICADSLTPLDENKQMTLGDDLDFEKKLSAIRNKYFATNDENKKLELRKKYNLLIESDPKLFDASLRNQQLKTFKPFETNNQANFFDQHTMFGLNNFNMIIGNPPYVVLRSKAYKPLVSHLRSIDMYKYAQGGNLNLYRHFIERSIRLLEQNGVLSFIVPSTIIADKSSAGIRTMMKDVTDLEFVVEFPEDAKIFESITQATTIFLLSRNDKPEKDRPFYISIDNHNGSLPPEDRVIVNWEIIKLLSGPELSLPLIKSDFEIELIKKLRANRGTFVDQIKIYTGDIDQTKHSEFMSNVKANKLLVVGNHVSHFDIDLSVTKNEKRWFNQTKSHIFDLPERIVIQGIANMAQRIRIKGSILPSGIVVGNSTNCIEKLSDDYSYEYLLGLLSSEVANWFFRKFSTNNNVNAYEVVNVPFPNATKLQISQVEKSVKKMLEIASKSKQESDLWHEELTRMNKVVFEIYGLTKEETHLVLTS